MVRSSRERTPGLTKPRLPPARGNGLGGAGGSAWPPHPANQKRRGGAGCAFAKVLNGRGCSVAREPCDLFCLGRGTGVS